MPSSECQELQIDLSAVRFESAEEYHAKASRFLSSHPLADFRKCPQLFHKGMLGLLPPKDRLAWHLGRAGHVRILEGRDKYDDAYAIGGPINPKTGNPFDRKTKAFAKWAAAQGRPVLTDEQAQLMENLAVGVTMNDAAVDLISDGVAEGVVRAEYCGDGHLLGAADHPAGRGGALTPPSRGACSGG